jgi:hypothetical protein
MRPGERGKCEGRKTRIERAERENKLELVKALTARIKQMQIAQVEATRAAHFPQNKHFGESVLC